jgi:hypothetical protein
VFTDGTFPEDPFPEALFADVLFADASGADATASGADTPRLSAGDRFGAAAVLLRADLTADGAGLIDQMQAWEKLKCMIAGQQARDAPLPAGSGHRPAERRARHVYRKETGCLTVADRSAVDEELAADTGTFTGAGTRTVIAAVVLPRPRRCLRL